MSLCLEQYNTIKMENNFSQGRPTNMNLCNCKSACGIQYGVMYVLHRLCAWWSFWHRRLWRSRGSSRQSSLRHGICRRTPPRRRFPRSKPCRRVQANRPSVVTCPEVAAPRAVQSPLSITSTCHCTAITYRYQSWIFLLFYTCLIAFVAIFFAYFLHDVVAVHPSITSLRLCKLRKRYYLIHFLLHLST